MAVGGLLAAASSAHAISYTFITIELPGASTFTLAQGINDEGQIVGGFGVSTEDHGFLDTGGIFTTIDVPGGINTVANGINGAGQIVGTFDFLTPPWHRSRLPGHASTRTIQVRPLQHHRVDQSRDYPPSDNPRSATIDVLEGRLRQRARNTPICGEQPDRSQCNRASRGGSRSAL
jgi:hypothetical protein